MHAKGRTMRIEHLLATAAGLGCGFVAIAALVHLAPAQSHRREVPPKAALSSDMHLSASIDKVKREVYVSVHNDGPGTYLVALGALFPSSRFQGLRFTLLRDGEQPERVELSFDEPGVLGGNGGPWVAVFTPGAEFDFSFPLESLRLFHSLRTAVADLHERYTLKVDFPGLDPNSELDVAFVRNWRQNQLNAAIPFWQGKLATQVTN
jgi:hypothetical protein